jgi:hypothetical protein
MTGRKPPTDMLNPTYRIYLLKSLLFLTGVVSFLFISSCNKETGTGTPPVISFIHGSGFLTGDTTLAAGQRVKIGINASGTDACITYFSVRFNDGTSRILLDTGMNTMSLKYNVEIIKTNAPFERWTFLVMNRNRIQDSITIILTKADTSAWRPIKIMDDLVLGFQESTSHGSFLALTTGSVMTLDEAFANQPLTDVVIYYGQYEATLASPNEAEAPGFFTGPHGISNWTVKNETRYDTTTVSAASFDKALNDSLIVAEYEPTAGKKKGKYLQPGMVLSFRSPSGKLGLICIREVNPGPAGSVGITIKIQE